MRKLTIQSVRGPLTVGYVFWGGERLASTRLRPICTDAETSMIEDPRVIPDLALVTASDGKTHAAIHPDRIGEFLLAHREQYFVAHNFQFDFWVIDRHLRRTNSPAARVLWDACHAGRVLDTMLLDQLLQLATGKFRRKGGDKVYAGGLADVLADYCTLRVDKSDPYRTRFGELVGLPPAAWDRVDPGFFEYAVRDAVATHALYPALAYAADGVMREHGFDPKAERYDIRPDAVGRFGYLGELIQVKASVALAYMSRNGVRVDLAGAKALEARYRDELAGLVAALERDHRDVLAYDRNGALKLAPKSGAPSLGPKRLAPKLQAVSAELAAAGTPPKIPPGSPRNGGVSLSAKHWAPYADRHPFLGLWVRVGRLTKRLGFLARMTAEVLHGEYDLLKRTGRTGCSAPRSAGVPGLNLQQVPRDPEFRGLFVAGPGRVLFTGDYAAAELRTLAAVCKAKFGFSKLGEVIAAGTDPHAFTAAAILGLSVPDFLAMKKTDPKRCKEYRQAAKALNFGIPGGLGAETLVGYAAANYGVTLTPEQAAGFRRKLITEVYPELNDADGYLSDDVVPTLARSLGVREGEVWDALDPGGGRSPLAARGAAKVLSGTSTAGDRFQSGVWAGVGRLARYSPDLPPGAAEAIAREEGSAGLAGGLLRRRAACLTGRVRAGVGFCDGKNTPFQGLSADAGKLALWNLLHRGFDVVAFVHDEIVVGLPAEGADVSAREVARVMEAAAEEVMGHGIPAACEYAVGPFWKKA